MELIPVKTEASNTVFTAPKGMENCSDLHVEKHDDVVISTWKFKTLKDKLKFLFHGNIDLYIWGSGMPPVALICNKKKEKQTIQQRTNNE